MFLYYFYNYGKVYNRRKKFKEMENNHRVSMDRTWCVLRLVRTMETVWSEPKPRQVSSHSQRELAWSEPGAHHGKGLVRTGFSVRPRAHLISSTHGNPMNHTVAILLKELKSCMVVDYFVLRSQSDLSPLAFTGLAKERRSRVSNLCLNLYLYMYMYFSSCTLRLSNLVIY